MELHEFFITDPSVKATAEKSTRTLGSESVVLCCCGNKTKIIQLRGGVYTR